MYGQKWAGPRESSIVVQCSMQYKLLQCKQSSALLMTSAAKRTIDYSFTLWRRVQQSTEEPSVYSYSSSTYGTYHQESKVRDYIILLILSSFFTGYPHNPYNGVVCNDTITATGVFSSKQLWRLAKGTYYNYLVNGSVNDQSVIIAKLLTFELNKHIQGHPYYYHQIYFLTLYFQLAKFQIPFCYTFYTNIYLSTYF